MTKAGIEEARREAAAQRSRDYRARRRSGEIVVTIAVTPADLHALERIGLLPQGERDTYAVGRAVVQFLGAAPGVALIGEGLFPAAAGGAGNGG